MYFKLILGKSTTQFCITSIGLRIWRSKSNIIARRLSLDYRAICLLLETRMKIKREKQGTDVNREFVAPLSTRIGTKDGDGGSSESRYSRLRGWNAIPRDPIKSRFPPSPPPLSLFRGLSPSTVPLFRNGESRNFGNELSRGNPKKRGKREESDRREQLFQLFVFSTSPCVPLLASRCPRSHNSREEESAFLLTDGNLRRIVISTEMHGYRGISGVPAKLLPRELCRSRVIVMKKRNNLC